MVASTYTITVVSEQPPQVYIGDRVGGAEIVELKRKDDELLSASQLAKLYGISTQTVRRKLAEHNQGSDGKYLYNPLIADSILNPTKIKTRGARRKN